MGDDLAEAIRQARQEELNNFSNASPDEVPGPMAESTFELCKLRWDELASEEPADFLRLYRKLIEIRKAEIIPRLYDMGANAGKWRLVADSTLEVEWTLGDGSKLSMIANLSADPV